MSALNPTVFPWTKNGLNRLGPDRDLKTPFERFLDHDHNERNQKPYTAHVQAEMGMPCNSAIALMTASTLAFASLTALASGLDGLVRHQRFTFVEPVALLAVAAAIFASAFLSIASKSAAPFPSSSRSQWRPCSEPAFLRPSPLPGSSCFDFSATAVNRVWLLRSKCILRYQR